MKEQYSVLIPSFSPPGSGSRRPPIMRIRIRNTGFLSFIVAGAVAGAAKGVTVSATLGFILYEYIVAQKCSPLSCSCSRRPRSSLSSASCSHWWHRVAPQLVKHKIKVETAVIQRSKVVGIESIGSCTPTFGSGSTSFNQCCGSGMIYSGSSYKCLEIQIQEQ